MIAPAKSARIRDLGVVKVEANSNQPNKSNAAERVLETSRQWIADNPTTAVVASVVLGLLVGYVVKRRR